MGMEKNLRVVRETVRSRIWSYTILNLSTQLKLQVSVMPLVYYILGSSEVQHSATYYYLPLRCLQVQTVDTGNKHLSL